MISLRRFVRRVYHSILFAFLMARRDPSTDALYEFWISLDPKPPRPSEFAAARRVFSDVFIGKVITWRSELGPEGLDVLRRDLVGACRRAAWEGDSR